MTGVHVGFTGVGYEIFFNWNELLSFLLDEQRKHFIDWSQQIHQQDLHVNMIVLLIQTLQKFDDLIFFSITLIGGSDLTITTRVTRACSGWPKILNFLQ